MAEIQNTVPMARLLKHSDIIVAGVVILIVIMMIIPLPPALLDVLLAFNITISLAILLVTMYTTEPLQFSVFPSLLLITTLFRLALNVSSTRLILLHGYAGEVIRAFGNFVVGGNYVVGMVVFLILVIIQFIVITNGAGRVAEVAARFTLDAMPGKQMSIDADLNSGLIDEAEARRRRRAIEREADFYGAMDGASKFVKGDAIAGIIITIINILGGIIIGIVQLGIPPMEAMGRFALLTVGDGLVSQIPALLISTATGIIVTRAASDSNLGRELTSQIFSQPKVLGIASALLVFFGLIPGLPKVPFFVLAAATGGIAYMLRRAEPLPEEEAETAVALEKRDTADDMMSLIYVDPMEVEIGYGLISLADAERGGDLLDRVTMVRRQIALELGLVVPPIRIHDNMQIKPNSYRVKIRGNEIASGEILADHYLAMDSGLVTEKIDGVETREPAFGMPAIWITEDMREKAELAGYTVVDPSSVMATHLTELVKSHAAELLGRQDVKDMLEKLKETNAVLVEELIPELMTVGDVQKVLQNLLADSIPINDLVTILERCADYARVARGDLDALTEYVREGLARTITRLHQSAEGEITVITVDPEVEEAIGSSLRSSEDGSYPALDPSILQRIVNSLSEEVRKMAEKGLPPVILTVSHVRLHLGRIVKRVIPGVAVLSYNEIAPGVKVRSIGTVRI